MRPTRLLAAHLLFEENLTIRMELNDQLGIAVLLSAMADMAIAETDLTRATYLAAASETLLTAIDGTLQPDERTQQDKTIATVREALGDPAIQSAWEAGQQTMKEAVELVLKEKERIYLYREQGVMSSSDIQGKFLPRTTLAVSSIVYSV